MNKPLWISVEGIDGCGKSTLIANLLPFFEERKVPMTVLSMFQKGPLRDAILHQPTVDPLQELLISRALHAETHKAIEELLAKGTTVITDRGPDSFYAYPDPAVITPEKFELLDQFYPFPRRPDVSFLISLQPGEALERMKLRGEQLDEIEKRGLGFQNRVSNALHALFQQNKTFDEKGHKRGCYYLPGGLSPDEITHEAIDVLSFYFPDPE